MLQLARDCILEIHVQRLKMPILAWGHTHSFFLGGWLHPCGIAFWVLYPWKSGV